MRVRVHFVAHPRNPVTSPPPVWCGPYPISHRIQVAQAVVMMGSAAAYRYYFLYTSWHKVLIVSYVTYAAFKVSEWVGGWVGVWVCGGVCGWV